jgi:uncharacterized protein YbaR (Trm112 family)
MDEAVGPNLFDENIVCPLSTEVLKRSGDRLTFLAGRQYDITDDIPLLFVDENDTAATTAAVSIGCRNNVTHEVKRFYEDAPFPTVPDR